METKSTEERVILSVSAVFGKDADQIARETRLIEDLMAKSLNYVELTAVLESEFDIEIALLEARRRRTVGELVALVDSLLEQ